MLAAQQLVADQLPFPARVVGEPPPAAATPAPAAGEHTEQILTEVLGYGTARIAALRAAGALGAGHEPASAGAAG